MELIFSFLIGTALFAMAGHVLWLAILGLFQGLARMWGPEQREPILAEMCPVCGEAWKKDAGLNACPMCTWSKSGPITKASPNPDHVLAVLRARALRYTKAGLITADECAQMIPHIVGEKIRPQPVLQTTRPLTVHTQTVPPEQSRQQPVPKPVTQPPAPNRPPLLAAAQNTTIEQAQPERSAAPAAERSPHQGVGAHFGGQVAHHADRGVAQLGGAVMNTVRGRAQHDRCAAVDELTGHRHSDAVRCAGTGHDRDPAGEAFVRQDSPNSVWMLSIPCRMASSASCRARSLQP